MQWSDTYELGISQLDENNRHLVGLLNSAYDCCLFEDQDGSLDTILEGLISYTGSHFSAEEQLMSDYDFLEQKEHTQEHALFRRQVTQLRQDMLEGKLFLGIEMVNFLGKWLEDHILFADKELCKYLASRGVTLSLSYTFI
jgi:hemerythrin-like metal-binding protein